MLQLPNAIREIAGLAEGATVQDLMNYIETGSPDILDGLLTSEASIAMAAASLENFSKYKLRMEDQVGTLQYKYCRINYGNRPDHILVGLIPNGSLEAPPTDLENLIFWAIINSNLSWHQSGLVDSDSKIVSWRSLAKGKAIIAEPIDDSYGTADQQVISAMFGLSHPDIPTATLPIPLVSAASLINVDARPGNYSITQARLLFEASSVQHAKWRFLSLYRILENAYLSNIKQTLLIEFDVDASKAVDKAKKDLSSEVNQLVFLAEQSDLTTEFEVFNDSIERLIGSGNTYIIKLDLSASTDALYGAREPYKKAVLRFYKIRCSIAHAGTSSVIYEQFSDANAATLVLLPIIETIALKSMKITAT